MMEKTNTAKNLRALCEAAVLVALAIVLSLLQFPPFRFDVWIFGGSIDFVMLPLFIMCWRLEPKWSVPACFIFGVIKFVITGYGVGYGIIGILLDYVLAYGVIGIAAFFRNMKGGLFIGAVVGSVARFIVHFISGVTIYSIATVTEPVEFMEMSFGGGQGMAFLYSLVYNGSFMLGEFIYCLAILLVIYKPLCAALKTQ